MADIYFLEVFPGQKKYGWYRGEKFTTWIGALIEEKTGNPESTFKELHNKGYKDLYVTANMS